MSNVKDRTPAGRAMGRPKVADSERREKYTIRLEKRLLEWAKKTAPRSVGDFINSLVLKEYKRQQRKK